MAIISVPRRSGVSVKLNAGTDPTTSKAIIKSVPINGVKPNADGEQILNIVDLLAAVLVYPVGRVEFTVVNDLERDG